MNDIRIFTNSEFGQVRAMLIEGNPWFVGKDVAEKLGYSNTRDAVVRHIDEDDKAAVVIHDGSQNRYMTLINESGLYSLVLSSKLESAKRFKKWVTSDVLPSIRKSGAYMTKETIEKVVSDPDFLIRLASELKGEKDARILSETMLLQQKPLIQFANKISVSKNSILVREVAKLASNRGINIGEKRLWKKLRDWGLIFKNTTEPMQRGIEQGLFEVVEGLRESSSGTYTYKTTRVTGKGQIYIVKRLIEEEWK